MTRIASIHYLLGNKKESLKDICKENPDWNYDKLFSKTGINNRHILDDNETPEDLSYEAAKICIDNYKNKDIDGFYMLVNLLQTLCLLGPVCYKTD